MGAVVSNETNVNVMSDVVDSVTNNIIQNNSSCASSQTNTTDIDFSDIKGDFNLDSLNVSQTINLNLGCLQSSTNDVNIKENILKDLQQKLTKGNSGGLLFNNSYNVQVQQSISKFVDNLDISNVKSCIANSLNTTSLKAKNISGNVNLKNISITQVSNSVQNCIQNDSNLVSNVKSLQDNLSQESTVNSTMNMLIVAGICLFAFILVIVFVKLAMR